MFTPPVIEDTANLVENFNDTQMSTEFNENNR